MVVFDLGFLFGLIIFYFEYFFVLVFFLEVLDLFHFKTVILGNITVGVREFADILVLGLLGNHTVPTINRTIIEFYSYVGKNGLTYDLVRYLWKILT